MFLSLFSLNLHALNEEQDMKKSLAVYSIAYLILLMVVFGLQYVYSKAELHLLLNSYHTSILDTFFKYYSMFAEGPLYVIALLPILWKKIEMTMFFYFSELTGGALLQILKHLFSFDRPVCLFEHYQHLTLPLVEGVNMHHSNSFPSGHASTFFVFFTCCALLTAYHYQLDVKVKNHKKWLAINLLMLVLLIFAALGAYSRIYLSQHFLLDVSVGSIIGVVTPCLFFFFGRKLIIKLSNKIYKRPC